MIIAIRITGLNKMDTRVEETFRRLRMMKKYTAVLINETPDMMGMVEKVRNYIAFGKIDEKTLVELIKARAKIIGDSKAKVKDAEKIAKEVLGGKKLEELKIKPFFGLHPARGGINTKKTYPKGVIGDHKEEINKLVMRML